MGHRWPAELWDQGCRIAPSGSLMSNAVEVLRRTAKKRTASIDAQRWSVVEHLLVPGEVQVENTPCRLLDPDGTVGVPDLVLYLTDRAVLLGKPGETGRIDFAEIKHARAEQGPGELRLVMEAHVKDNLTEFVVDVYPSPISADLINDLLRALKKRSGGEL